MVGLSEKECVPCQGGIPPMERDEAEEKLEELDGWELAEDGRSIAQRFEFKNFVEAQAFVNQVGDIAEGEGHHPDIAFGWGYAEITIQTHKINGLHENDFILAAKISEI